MVKRKDTKLYQALVNKYCDARWLVEYKQKEIDDYYIKIGKAKRKFDFLSATPRMDEDIKEWYEGYTGVIQMTIGIMESGIKWDKEKMEQSGATLIADYGEDLDALYESHKDK